MAQISMPRSNRNIAAIIVFGVVVVAVLAVAVAHRSVPATIEVDAVEEIVDTGSASIPLEQAETTESVESSSPVDDLASSEMSSVPLPPLTRGQAAEAARLTALSDSLLRSSRVVMSRAQLAEAARLTGLANHYLGVSVASSASMSRGQVAEAARLTGLANYYQSSGEVQQSSSLTRGQAAYAARLTALAEAYGK
jgi:hypothetical protein